MNDGPTSTELTVAGAATLTATTLVPTASIKATISQGLWS